MATISDLLNLNKLRLNYSPLNYYNPVQQPAQPVQPVEAAQPVQQSVYPETSNLPTINPEIQAAYEEDLKAQPKGKIGKFMEKYGLTPGTIVQLAAGISALTGGDPYIASGVAQSGAQLAQQEAAQRQELLRQRAEYMKYRQKLTPFDLLSNVYLAGEGGLKQIGQVPSKAKVFKERETAEQVAAKAEAGAKARYAQQIENLPITEQIKAEIATKKAIEQEQGLRAGKLNEMNSVIDFFEKKINEIPVGSGTGGKLRGAALLAEAKIGQNEKVAAYEASLGGLRSQIARGLGEVGNLSEQEQAAAMKLLPTITDNDETRAQKIQNFREYITTKLEKNVYFNKNKPTEKGKIKKKDSLGLGI